MKMDGLVLAAITFRDGHIASWPMNHGENSLTFPGYSGATVMEDKLQTKKEYHDNGFCDWEGHPYVESEMLDINWSWIAGTWYEDDSINFAAWSDHPIMQNCTWLVCKWCMPELLFQKLVRAREL